ncbi:hypothetical protein HOD83_00450 [Candidatus Woesearchaeota archaeon]|nr:hypothetical protein [Candidatus Woesearchaeota archaeon]
MRKLALFLVIFGLMFVVPDALAESTNISTAISFVTNHVNQQHILSMSVNGQNFVHAIFLNESDSLVWIASNDTGASWGTDSTFNDSKTTLVDNCGSTDCLSSGSITSDASGNIYVAYTNDLYQMWFAKGTYTAATNSWSWADSQLVPTGVNEIEYPTILRFDSAAYSNNEEFLHVVFMANFSQAGYAPGVYTSIDNGTNWGANYPAYDDQLAQEVLSVPLVIDQKHTSAVIKSESTRHKIFLTYDNSTATKFVVGKYQDASGFTWGTDYLAPDEPGNYDDQTEAVVVNSLTTNLVEPDIAITGNAIHISYLNTTGSANGEVMYINRATEDPGTPWGPTPTILSEVDGWAKIKPSLSVDTDGNLFVMWGTYNPAYVGPGHNADMIYVKSADSGSSWTNFTLKTDTVDRLYYPSLSSTNGVIGQLWYMYGTNDLMSAFVDFIPTNCGCSSTTEATWTVSSNQTCKNGECNLTGDLNVTAGTLELYNYTIRVNSTSTGEYGIDVNNAAGMEIRDSSNVSAFDANFNYYFRILNNAAQFNMYNSFLSECGYDNGSYMFTGFYLDYAPGTRILYNLFEDNYNGIIINATPNWFTNNNITGNERFGMVLIGGDAGDGNQMYDNRIFGNDVGQLNSSQCNQVDISENYWGSINLTDIRSNITEHNGTCSDDRYMDICPLADSNLDRVPCPGDWCNQDSDCVSDHQICLPDYDNITGVTDPTKYCGCSAAINDLYVGITSAQFNCTVNSCVHDTKTYDNGTTAAPYFDLNLTVSDSNQANWSCFEGYWTEDPIFNSSAMSDQTSFLEALTSGVGFSQMLYILVPQLFLPNASVLFAELDIIGLSYGGGYMTSSFTVDVGNDDTPEYTAASGLTQTDSPGNVTFTEWLQTYLVSCDCANCTLDADGNCLIGINVSTASTTGKAIITNLHLGLCQMKGQACTYNVVTGAEGKCYDLGSDAEYDCAMTCSENSECVAAGTGTSCCSFGVCAADSDECDAMGCGSIGVDCCAGNTCPTSGECRCVARADSPQCVDTATSKYEIFNITSFNATNLVYYTYENSTGQLNSCCLSLDNTTCRGWLNITSS